MRRQRTSVLIWRSTHRRLLGPIGNIPPAEAEAIFYAAESKLDMAA